MTSSSMRRHLMFVADRKTAGNALRRKDGARASGVAVQPALTASDGGRDSTRLKSRHARCAGVRIICICILCRAGRPITISAGARPHPVLSDGLQTLYEKLSRRSPNELRAYRFPKPTWSRSAAAKRKEWVLGKMLLSCICI